MITKEEITGMIGAAIFMVLLLVILLFSYFTLAASSDDLGGIPVMFGNMEEAGGYEEPPMVDITPEEVMEIPAPQNTPSEVPLIAQTDEASIVIKEQKRKEEEKARQEEIRREEERRRQAEAERKRREERKHAKQLSTNKCLVYLVKTLVVIEVKQKEVAHKVYLLEALTKALHLEQEELAAMI